MFLMTSRQDRSRSVLARSASHLSWDWNCSVHNLIDYVNLLSRRDGFLWYHIWRDKHPGGLFIEPAFSTFAVFVIGFIPQITVVLHLPESSISLKSTRVLLTGNVKNLSGSLFFSALSVLDNVCSELGLFVGTVFPSPLPRAGGKAFHALFLSPCASLKIPGVHCVQNSSQGFDTNLSWGSARRHTVASHHICEEVQDDIQ